MKQKKLANILNIEVFLNNRDIKKKIAYRLAHIYNKISLLNDELNKYDEQTFTTDYFIHNIPNSTLLRVIFNHIQHDHEMNTLFKDEINRVQSAKETQI